MRIYPPGALKILCISFPYKSLTKGSNNKDEALEDWRVCEAHDRFQDLEFSENVFPPLVGELLNLNRQLSGLPVPK